MVSEKRIEANRRNAQKSSGPRSIDGRARSSMNALRHGITGQVSIMTVEDRGAHDKFVQELIAGLQPEGAVELQFASVIAEDFWRLQRIRAVENDMLALGNFSDAAAIDVDHPEIHASLTRAQTFLDQSKDFERLTLYEQRINRAIEKNRKQLAEVQAERKREREEALEQACLLHQAPATPELPDNAEPAPASNNGFVFSSEEIERAIHHRSRLIQGRTMQTRADGVIKAAVIKAALIKPRSSEPGA
jgi:hypothetical protein